ncbi:MAG: hypothetical protein DRP84_02635 [Spirochaetes bacterium]|nr:MAG: hypothetical protein DRP84_02635 [Spirochaetota bacterium]
MSDSGEKHPYLINQNKKNSCNKNNKTRLISSNIYLPAGSCEIVLYIDNQKFFSSFKLYFRKQQELSNNLRKGKVLEYSL